MLRYTHSVVIMDQPASARALAVPEILDLTFSFFTASDLPALAQNVAVSRAWRRSIVRRLQQSELDLYRIAGSACRYRRFDLLVSTCQAVSHLPYQSPRVDLSWEEISPFARSAAWWYFFSSDNATVEDIDKGVHYTTSSLISRRFGDIYNNPEWYLEKTFGRHKVPAPGGFRLVNLPIKQLAFALFDLSIRARYGIATMFLVSQYGSFFPQLETSTLIKDFFQDLLRVDNATSIKALCDSYPCLPNMTFTHKGDTLLTMACGNYARPWSSVEMLLEQGADATVTPEVPDQMWPLEGAMKLRFPSRTILALVQHGARVRWTVLKDVSGGMESPFGPEIMRCIETAVQDDKTDILADKDGSEFVLATKWWLQGCPARPVRQNSLRSSGLKRASSWVRTKSSRLYEAFHR